MRVLKRTFLYLLAFMLFMLVLMVVINLPAFDEDLLPEVQAIKNIQAQPYSANNAYPALIAINGPSGKTLKQATQEVREFLNHKIQTTGIDYLTYEESDELLGKGHDKSWQNIYHSCNSRADRNCMEQLYNELQDRPIMDARLIEQLSRYNAFIEYPDYKEATQLKFDSPLPSYGALLKLKRIYLANLYANQDLHVYLDQVIKDLKFWRMVLKNSKYLLTKMIAVATIYDDIHSLSAAIRRGHLGAEELEGLLNNMYTLNAAEMDLSQVFEYELKTGIEWYETAESADDLGKVFSLWNMFNGLFYQPKATVNFNYLNTTEPLKNLSLLNAEKFYQLVNVEQWAKDFSPTIRWTPSMLYNYVGKVLVSYSKPAYKDYIGRVHDLNGMFYLLLLQTEIALQPDQPVEQLINQSKYTNPYTLEPMLYNKPSHSIYFKCMDKTSSCELSL